MCAMNKNCGEKSTWTQMEVRLRAAAAPRTRPARDTHATPRLRTRACVIRPCTMHGPTTTSHTARPCTAKHHHATKYSSKQHTAHCTRPCRSNRPARHRRTPGTVAACAKSCVYGGARGSQHPKCPGTSANWPLTSSQHMPGPLSHQHLRPSLHVLPRVCLQNAGKRDTL